MIAQLGTMENFEDALSAIMVANQKTPELKSMMDCFAEIQKNPKISHPLHEKLSKLKNVDETLAAVGSLWS